MWISDVTRTDMSTDVTYDVIGQQRVRCGPSNDRTERHLAISNPKLDYICNEWIVIRLQADSAYFISSATTPVPFFVNRNQLRQFNRQVDLVVR